jgi:TolB-like protein/DNA-binding winged helix-turn-helix (wHTH) protein/tetratricopeptide (TPR) repeat protein
MGVPEVLAGGRTGRQRYRFSSFEVDFRAAELRKGGSRVRLSGQPLQVLEVLLERAGEAVTRDELRHRLWHADTFVDFEHNLNSAVKRLRAALGDAADNPRFIETVPRVGYRFVGTLSEEPPAAAAPRQTSTGLSAAAASLPGFTLQRPDGARRAAFFSAAFLALTVGLVWWSSGRAETTSASISSVVVLPFREVTPGRGGNLAEGVTASLVNSLARLTPVRVVSQTTAMPYRDRGLDVSAIGRALRVDAVVEGTVTRVGERLRVAVQLVHAPTDRHLWAAAYDGVVDDLLSFQERVSVDLAGAVRTAVLSAHRLSAPTTHPVPPDVRARYLKGRHLLRRRTLPELTRALRYFDEALKEAPDYALAHAGVAAVWVEIAQLPAGLPAKESLARARAAALEALRHDPDLVEALTSLAFVLETVEQDLTAAEQTYRRAIELDPGYAPARQRYAAHLARTGRPAEAVETARFGRDLDPASVNANVELAQTLMSAGRAEEALEPLVAAVELEPDYFDPHVHLAELHAHMGRFDQAIAAAGRAVELSGRSAHALQALAIVYARTGRHEEAAALIRELETHPTQRSAWDLAMIHLAANQRDRAFFWLRQACVERPPTLAFLKSVQALSQFDPIREDPRFGDILECAEPAA